MTLREFRQLSFRQKLQWILQYYGIAILVGFVALAVAICFFTSVFGGGEECALKVMILDDRQSADNCRIFAEELGEALGGECEVSCYAPGATYEMQAFVVRLTADELDVIIAPEEQARELVANGYLQAAEVLAPDSRYQAITRKGKADGSAVCIGIAVRSPEPGAAAKALRYFTEAAR